MLHPIDIITRENELTGAISDPEEASNKGFWHRGVHVIVSTNDGFLLVQKRSSHAMKDPGKLDVSAGGFVDSGETPEQAAVREVQEETGLLLDETGLSLLSVTRYNHRWKYGRRRKISRSIIYTYLARVDADKNAVTVPQKDEVEWIGFLPLKSVQWLVRRHFLKRFGYLMPTYSYYRKILRAASQQLKR